MTSTTDILAANNTLIQSKANAAATDALTNAGKTADKTSAKSAFSSLSGDVDFFLKLLTTQLKNQDPTQPFDTAQMTQQIAQYSGVEQQIKTNSNLEKLLTANSQSQSATAVGYIAKEIEYEGNTGQIIGGQGAFSYSLPSEAANADITIKNSGGSVVFQGKGSTKAGRNILIWDGMNSVTGKQEPDGIYTLGVSAKDAATKDIKVTLKSVGIVSGVETSKDGTIQLGVGNTQVPLSTVQVVREPNRANLANVPAGTGSSS